jgi:hypothetical protein
VGGLQLALETGKTQSQKMPENAVRTHLSTARIVRRIHGALANILDIGH